MDRKRRSDGDGGDRYDDNRDIEVGQVADRRKESAHRREKWDEDARAMSKSFRIEDCRQAMETMRSCPQSQYDLSDIYSPPRVVKEANGMGMKGGFSLEFSATQTVTSGTSANMNAARRRSRRSESAGHT